MGDMKDIAVRPQVTGVMAVADGYDVTDRRGKEGITSDDLRLAFLAIAQKTSKALDATEGVYIEGLKFLDLYNSETRQIYGPGPLRFLPLLHRKRAHLRAANGLLERDQIDWSDPRATWEGARKEGRDKPEGVRIYDWVVLLMPSYELVVVSFMSKSFPAGQTLTSLVQTRPGPAFSGQYSLRSVSDENDSGKFGKFHVVPAGKPAPEEVEFAAAVYESIKGKTLVVDDDELNGATTDDGAATDGATDGVRAPVPF